MMTLELRDYSLAPIEDYASSLIPSELPALEKALGLPELSLSLVFREKFRFGDLLRRIPDEKYELYLETPDGEMEKRTLRGRGVIYTYQDAHASYEADPETPPRGALWAFTPVEYQVEFEIRQKLHQAVIERFRDASEYGFQGGLLLSNFLGGLDIFQPKMTAKHLLARLAIAHRYFQMTPEKMAKHNIIHPLIYGLAKENFNELNYNVEAILAVANLASIKSGTPTPLLESLSKLGAEIAEEYVKNISGEVNLLAHTLADPQKTIRVIKVLSETRSFRGILKDIPK